MSDTEQNLLGSIPVGEEIKDLREGTFPDATIGGVELLEQSNGHAVRVTYTNLTDSEGHPFEYAERYTIPTRSSEDFIQRIFLNAAHAWGIVPQNNNQRIFADTEDARAAIVAAVNSVRGNSVPLKLTRGQNGYLQSRFIRVKK